jgi:methyl-accepting chemotaxis protein
MDAPDRAVRWRYLIKPSLQIRYAALVFFAMAGVVIFVGWNSYFTMARHVFGEIADPKALDLFHRLNVALFWRIVVYMAALVAAAVFLSHRWAGPLHRMETVIDGVAQGDLRQKFALRRKDWLTDLHRSLTAMLAGLREKVAADRDRRDRILAEVQKLQAELSALPAAQEQLRKIQDLSKAMTEDFRI